MRVQANLNLQGRGSSCPGWHCDCIKGVRGGVKEVQECVSAGVGAGRRRGAEGQVAVGVGACVFGLHLTPI